MTQRKISLPVILIVLLTIGLLNSKSLAQSTNDPTFEGQQAPSFTLTDLNGNQVNSDSYKGSYLVIHIATTWCPFCNAEAPHLEQLNKDYKNKT